MKPFFGVIALFGLILSVVVHGAALCGVNIPAQFPAVWGLHGLIFVLGFALYCTDRRFFGEKVTVTRLRAALPAPVFWIGVALTVYVILNFVLFLIASEGGSPDILDGKYVLMNHGKLMREISAAEYAAFRANIARGFSGHWLAFYFDLMALFLFRKKEDARISA